MAYIQPTYSVFWDIEQGGGTRSTSFDNLEDCFECVRKAIMEPMLSRLEITIWPVGVVALARAAEMEAGK